MKNKNPSLIHETIQINAILTSTININKVITDSDLCIYYANKYTPFDEINKANQSLGYRSQLENSVYHVILHNRYNPAYCRNINKFFLGESGPGQSFGLSSKILYLREGFCF